MDQNKKTVLDIKIARTMDNLIKNNMQAYYVETKEQVIDKIKELTKEGDTVTCGGSQTLFEAGVIEHLRSGRYNYLDRYEPGLSSEQITEIFRKAFSADVYICSSNAVTEKGELYNVDGSSNRVSAMVFGPKSVIVVAGLNKIVKNLDEAVQRVRNVAAPMNAVRLHRNTPCVHTGSCMDCSSESRICCNYVTMARQIIKDRVKVIIVGEELGY